ncbi:hypothetical protein A8990_11641 [Paenibacillus taihuensis]|uniref:Uncharacterized protein n=1 Tax=Paenibacillus taihuensis TaxID=1156355 RepID=A0A3D9S5M6_9BACL|nr:hypothetical protein [Paenibacillus taihuensis]REE83862.1 hypothetical protein A8990_11641 [Paenibacillus taihuensis]
MPRVVDINLDAEDMVLTIEREKTPKRIGYSSLNRVVKGKLSVRKLLRTIDVKSIELHVKGMDVPIVIASNNVKDYENVENHLLKVAERYNVSIES